MLNIISRSIVSDHNRGPRKVVVNLIKGLEEIGYPFIVNAALEATDAIWIHDDSEALKRAMELPPHVAIVAGPNIYTLPSEIPSTIDTSRIIWIHPAPWVKDFWNKFSDKEIISEVWPVGIDTSKFRPEINEKRDLILVYNKQRSDDEISSICRNLDFRGEKYVVVTYGKYKEKEYRNLLKKAKAIIWVGRSESQGIALLEALSTNVPALIWDISTFGHWTGNGHQYFTDKQLDFSEATSAPYFDNQCGLRFFNKDELDSVLPRFLENLPIFQPRKYIEENLCLTKQAMSFLDIYKNHFGTEDYSLRNTVVTTKKMWRNNSVFFRTLMTCKDAIRLIIR